MTKLNSKTLTIAAVVLMVLALLYMATPLLRTATGFAGMNGVGRTLPGGQDFTPGQGFNGQGSGGQDGQGFVFQNPPSGDTQGQVFPSQGQGNTNFPTRQFGTGRNGLLGLGFLNGTTGTIVYAIALLVSLAAAVGMFMTKAWGKILGIIMGVIYTVLAAFSFVPTLLIGLVLRSGTAFHVGISLNSWLSVVHLVLAIAVIILALLPAKKVVVPVTPPAVPPADAV